jgi:hypothetical protein
MATDISMASNALVLIGDDPISALSESVAASNLYANTYEYVLSLSPWTFALKEVKFSRLSQTPDIETGFIYAFQKPTDLIRLWAVLPTTNYRMVGEFIYSNNTEMFGRYVYKSDETGLPAHIVKCIQYKLASEFSVSVAEDEKKMEMFERMFQDALGQAMSIDSMQQPYAQIRGNPIRRGRRHQ